MAAGVWTNPCGGAGWRELGDGTIELEGLGAPSYPAASAEAKMLGQTYANWAPLFSEAAQKYGLPVAWLVAIATVETGAWASSPDKQAGIGSSAGAAGVMQLMPAAAGMYGYSPDERFDPKKNIDMGAHYLADALKTSAGSAGFPALAAIYNAGHACPTQKNVNAGNVDSILGLAGEKDYPSRATRMANTALGLGIAQASAGGGFFWASALTVGSALAWWLLRRR